MSIIYRPPSAAAGAGAKDPHGSWQATCPYHQKNAKTLCTKSLSIGGDGGPDAREAALNMVFHWLVQAPLFTRQKLHNGWNPRLRETPPRAVLVAQADDLEDPPLWRLHDEELDAAERAAAAATASGGGGEGDSEPPTQPSKKRRKVTAAKGKAAGKAAGKAKSCEPKAKAEAKANSCSSSSNSNSSSSSSSSSSGAKAVAKAAAAAKAKAKATAEASSSKNNSSSSSSSSD